MPIPSLPVVDVLGWAGGEKGSEAAKSEAAKGEVRTEYGGEERTGCGGSHAHAQSGKLKSTQAQAGKLSSSASDGKEEGCRENAGRNGGTKEEA